MKYEDIKKLIMPAGMAVTWDFSDLEGQLQYWADDFGIELDPDFQRGHVWTREQQIRFVEFTLKGGVTNPIMFNSPAYGGYSRKSNCDLSETLVIVDGKQRLEACLQFVRNNLPVFDGVYLNDFEDSRVILRRTSILFKVNTIQSKKELLKWYLELNEGHIAHSPEELERVRKLYNSI